MNKSIFITILTLSILMIACGSKSQIEQSMIIQQDDVKVDTQAIELEQVEVECSADIRCDIDSDTLDLDAQRYGGVKQEYVVRDCKVTIYNDGPIKMVDDKTDQPCNAPIPKDHQFSNKSKTYQENGCTITESEGADGLRDAVKDCS